MRRLVYTVGETLKPARHMSFRRFLIARSISIMGNAGTRVALVWFVLQEVRSPAWLGLVLVASTVPQFLFGLVAGVVANIASPKAVVVVADIVSGCVLLVLWATASFGRPNMVLVVCLVVVLAACAAFLNPSATVVIPQILPRESIAAGSSLRTLVDQVAQIAGPAAAGVIVAAGGAPVWFIVDAATFGLAAALFATIALPTSDGDTSEERSGVRGAITGVGRAGRFVRATRWLWVGLVAGAVANLLLVAPLAVVVPVVITAHGMGAAVLGGYGSLLAAGTVIGALVGGRLAAARQMQRALLALMVSGLLGSLLGIVPLVVTVLTVGALLGFMLAVFEVIWNSYELANVPQDVLANVLSWDLWLSFSSRTLGLAALGTIGAIYPTATSVASCLALTAVTAVLFVQTRALDNRAMRLMDEPADA